MSDNAPNGAPRVASGSVIADRDRSPRSCARSASSVASSRSISSRTSSTNASLPVAMTCCVPGRLGSTGGRPRSHRSVTADPGPATRAPTRRSCSWIARSSVATSAYAGTSTSSSASASSTTLRDPPVSPASRRRSVELPAGDDRRRPQQRHEHRADARRGDDDERHGPRSVPCAPGAAQRGGRDAAGRDDDRVAALPEEADRERDDGEGAAERDARSDGDVEGHDHRDRQQACRQPSRPERRGQRGAHPQLHMRQHYVAVRRGGER